MNHSPGALTSVRWNSLFPWLILVRAARVSLMIRVIALALAGILVTSIGWRLVEVTVLERDDAYRSVRLERLDESPALLLQLGEDADITAPAPTAAVSVDGRAFALAAEIYGSPLIRGWRWAMLPLARLHDASGWRQWIGYLAAGAWTVAVWALFGGAIARIAAVYLSYGETVGPVEALSAAVRKWRSTAGAILIAAIGVFALSLPLVLAGLLLRLDFTAAIVGVLWALVLLVGLVLAVALIGLAAGWPLMWSTVAVERTDGFDAISRAYGYVYQRPLHLAFYVLVASLLGLLAQFAVNLIVDATLSATGWAVSVGAGDARINQLHDWRGNPPEQLAERGIAFWSYALAWIAAGFPMAYLWPAATGIYLLQRRHVDSTEMTEVKFDEGEPRRGLPTLAEDAKTGVPRTETPT